MIWIAVVILAVLAVFALAAVIVSGRISEAERRAEWESGE